MRLPHSFNGFKNLTTLFLHRIKFIDDNALESLISSCSLLRYLKITHCLDSEILKIRAANLRSLVIHGSVTHLNLDESSMIIFARLHIMFAIDADLTNVLSSLKNIVDLSLIWYTLKFLQNGDMFPRKDIIFNRMKNLTLGWYLDCTKELIFVFCSFKRSPALEQIRIQCFGFGDDSFKIFWNRSPGMIFKVNRLRRLYMDQVCGTEPELKFIEFVLGNAPLLEQVFITQCGRSQCVSEYL